jgi:hypothetical protein
MKSSKLKRTFNLIVRLFSFVEIGDVHFCFSLEYPASWECQLDNVKISTENRPFWVSTLEHRWT